MCNCAVVLGRPSYSVKTAFCFARQSTKYEVPTASRRSYHHLRPYTLVYAYTIPAGSSCSSCTEMRQSALPYSVVILYTDYMICASFMIRSTSNVIFWCTEVTDGVSKYIYMILELCYKRRDERPAPSLLCSRSTYCCIRVLYTTGKFCLPLV